MNFLPKWRIKTDVKLNEFDAASALYVNRKVGRRTLAPNR